MKIINETHWRTDHLRAFVMKVAEQELDPEVRRRFSVHVIYRRTIAESPHVGGYAHYHSRRITLKMPKGTSIAKDDLAFTIAHEMAHSRGLHHRDMHSPRYAFIEGWQELYAWAKDLPMEVKPPKAKPSIQENRIARLDHARTKLAQWERRIKLAQTHRKKWQARYNRLVKVVGEVAKS